MTPALWPPWPSTHTGSTPKRQVFQCRHQASAEEEMALHVGRVHKNSTCARTGDHAAVSLQRSATSVRPVSNPSLLKVSEAIQSSLQTRAGPRVRDLNNPTGLLKATMRRCDLRRAPSTKQ